MYSNIIFNFCENIFLLCSQQMQDVSRCVEIVETQRFTRKMLSKSSKQNKKGETDKVSQVQRLSMPGKR
jgi:hypothetical protein